MVTKTALLGLVLAGCSVSVVSQVRNDPTLNDAFRQAVPSVSLRELVKRSPESGLNSSCFDPTSDYSQLKECLVSQVRIQRFGRMKGGGFEGGGRKGWGVARAKSGMWGGGGLIA